MLCRRFRDDKVRGDRHLRAAACFCAGLSLSFLVTVNETLAAEASASPRPIVARDNPVDTLANFFAAVDESSGQSGSLFRRVFGGSKSIAGQKLPVAPDKPDSGIRILMAADVDPRFERWQKDANERLKQEKANAVIKQHPFAVANPDKSVVVCEAGCRTPKDEIVYIAAMVPAVLPEAPSADQLEPNSSTPTADPAAQGLEEGELPCIAGCYDRPQRRTDAARRTAERREIPARPRAVERRITVADVRQAGTQHLRLAANKPGDQVVADAHAAGIAARIRSRLQVGHNGAIIEQRPHDTQQFARAGQASSMREVSTIFQTWRTKIAFAHADELNRSSVQRGLRQSRREDHPSPQTRCALRDEVFGHDRPGKK